MKPITISRSSVVTRKTCEMKRFMNYHMKMTPEQGTPGIVPVSAGTSKSLLPRVRGQILHAAAERIFLNHTWEAITQFINDECQVLDESMRAEQAVLIRRALLGWLNQRLEFINDFVTVSSEAEWQWDMDYGINLSLRLDRILRRKSDQALAILDFKTMRAPDKNWIERMQNSEQTHLYIQALRERSNEWVLGMVYEGIIIGSLDDDNHQKSPFVRAYAKRNGEYSPKYISGAPVVSTLDWSDDQWLDWAIRTNILQELYCTTGPLLPPFNQLVGTRNSTVFAELRWYGKLEQLDSIEAQYGVDSEDYHVAMERLIEKNPDACLKYGWEYACPYHSVCWNGAIPDAETFEPREDHHVTK